MLTVEKKIAENCYSGGHFGIFGGDFDFFLFSPEYFALQSFADQVLFLLYIKNVDSLARVVDFEFLKRQF